MSSTTIRTFIALRFDDDSLTQLGKFTESLPFPEAWLPSSRRTTQSSHLHVTMAFLGDTNPGLVRDILSLVEHAREGTKVIVTQASGLCFLPNPRRAKVIVLELLDGDGAMRTMANTLAESLEELGFLPEKRAFLPHVTLFRCRLPVDAKDWRGVSLPVLRLRMTRLVLYRSELSPRGAVYSELGGSTLVGGLA